MIGFIIDILNWKNLISKRANFSFIQCETNYTKINFWDPKKKVIQQEK